MVEKDFSSYEPQGNHERAEGAQNFGTGQRGWLSIDRTGKNEGIEIQGDEVRLNSMNPVILRSTTC